MEHTPGPWEWRFLDGDCGVPPVALDGAGGYVMHANVHCQPDGRIVAGFDFRSDVPQGEESVMDNPNARLIAAAPAMLKGYRDIIELVDALDCEARPIPDSTYQTFIDAVAMVANTEIRQAVQS